MLALRRGDAGVTPGVDWRTAWLLTLPPLLWAGNAVVGRLMVGQVPPLALNALRWGLAALLLAPLGWQVLRDRRAIAAAWPYLLALGCLGVGAYNALQYLALTSSTPLAVTLIAASTPLWMLLVGALAFGQRPAPRQLAGALLSLAGVVVVISRGAWATLAQVQFVAGDCYIVVAAICWSFYSWLLVQPPPALRAPPAATLRAWGWAGLLLLQMLFGIIAAGTAAAGEAWLAEPAPIAWHSAGVWAALLFVAIGPSILAYRSWGLGIARGGPALAAIFANLTPLFAALLSALVLGQAPHAYHVVAFALIVAGIAVGARRSK